MNKKNNVNSNELNVFDQFVIIEEETTMLKGSDFDLTCYLPMRNEALEMFSSLDTIWNNIDLSDAEKANEFANIFNKYIS